MNEITITLSDEELDLYVQGSYQPTVMLDSGKIDLDNQPILVEKANVSKKDFAENMINSVVFERIKFVKASNKREELRTVLEDTVKAEIDAVQVPQPKTVVLTQAEIDAVKEPVREETPIDSELAEGK